MSDESVADLRATPTPARAQLTVRRVHLPVGQMLSMGELGKRWACVILRCHSPGVRGAVGMPACPRTRWSNVSEGLRVDPWMVGFLVHAHTHTPKNSLATLVWGLCGTARNKPPPPPLCSCSRIRGKGHSRTAKTGQLTLSLSCTLRSLLGPFACVPLSHLAIPPPSARPFNTHPSRP